MSAIGLESNQYQDYATLPGTTFAHQFNVVPLDLTDATATMTIKGIGDADTNIAIPITLTVTNLGVNPTTNFAFAVDASLTVNWQTGSYPYQILVTLVDDVTVLPYGTGRVIVR